MSIDTIIINDAFVSLAWTFSILYKIYLPAICRTTDWYRFRPGIRWCKRLSQSSVPRVCRIHAACWLQPRVCFGGRSRPTPRQRGPNQQWQNSPHFFGGNFGSFLLVPGPIGSDRGLSIHPRPIRCLNNADDSLLPPPPSAGHFPVWYCRRQPFASAGNCW